MNLAVPSRSELNSELQGALDRGELKVHYQLQVDLTREGAICGFEALARWVHPVRGPVPPDEFIAVAEESGLIGVLGDWVLREACRVGQRWANEYDAKLVMAVNLSPRQFATPDLPARVAAALHDSGLPPENLALEITESHIMADAERSLAALAALKRLGIALAIDDFGTGYSSLAHLRRFPTDYLKIDRSLVADITAGPGGAAVCASIVAMAHALRLKVVAEGVENESQIAFLHHRQCDRVQGYYFGKPVPASEAEVLLQSGRRVALPKVINERMGQRTLLLLDDEENILAALKRVLRRDGYTLLTATHPDDAFAMLAANKVGVVISDQRMPYVTGTEFLRRVKDLYPDTVRMVLSGYTDLQSVADAINEGAIFRFLTKPWDDEQLREVVRTAFAQQEMSAENRRLACANEEAALRLAELNSQLERLVAEKAKRIVHDERFLAVVLEALHRLPVAVVATDDSGMVVLANAGALALWPEALPGADARDCLPARAAMLLSGSGEEFVEFDGPSGALRLIRRRVQVKGSGGGWMLAALPDLHAGEQQCR